MKRITILFYFLVVTTVLCSVQIVRASDKYGGGSTSSSGSSSRGNTYTSASYTQSRSAAISSAAGYTSLNRAYNTGNTYSAVSTYSSTQGWGYSVQLDQPYRSDGGGGNYTPSTPCTTYPNLQVTDILFIVPGTPLTLVGTNQINGTAFQPTAGVGVNQNNLTLGAQYEPVVVVTNSGCINTSSNPSATGGLNLFGGQTSNSTSTINPYHIDQLPFGQNGTFPVRLRIDFQNNSSYEITEYLNNQGPLAGGARIYVRFPAITTGEGGVHGIASTVDVTETEAPGQACAGAEGCVMERGTPTTNTRSETFAVTAPSVQIGSYLLNGPVTSISSTNRWRTTSYITDDRRFTDRDLAIDTNWNRPAGLLSGTYNNVGLYWTGTLINPATCTGTTIQNNGNALSDFNGQIDIPQPQATGNFDYDGGTFISGFPGSGHNLDLQIIEPVASTSHLYTVTCQTTSGGTVSDSILISNGLRNICGPGLVWDGLTCSASGGTTLRGNDCTILVNQSTCIANFSWDLTGAASPQIRNITTNTSYPNANRAVINAGHAITYGPNIVRSLDGSALLREITVRGSCAATAPWDSSRGVCYNASSIISTPTTPGSISVTVQSAVVRKFDRTNVDWQISNPIPAGYLCNLNGPGLSNISITAQTGSQRTEPIENTSVFNVTCDNGVNSISGEATVEIIPQVQEV